MQLVLFSWCIFYTWTETFPLRFILQTKCREFFYLTRQKVTVKYLCYIIFCISVIPSAAQKTVDVSSDNGNAMSPAFFMVVNGHPFVMAKFTKLVEGTPFFKDEWMKGNVVVNGGTQYSGIYLKLDLFDNEVHFQDQKGTEMIATTRIQKIILLDTAMQQLYNFVNGEFIQANVRIKGWYQLLTEGKATLLKKFSKQLHELRPYGSATVEQTIFTSPRYYILHDGTFTEIKKIKEMADILTDKRDEVAQYIKTNNLSGKTDGDFEKLVNYYNELK